MRYITWEEVDIQAKRIADHWQGRVKAVYGVPQGGAPLAVMISNYLNVPILEDPKIGIDCLIVDDLIDSGKTMLRFADKYKTDAAYRKSHSPIQFAPYAEVIDDWLSFPWEKNNGAPTDGIVRLIEYIGDDPTRNGLIDTPERVLKAYKEMTEGYEADIEKILSVSFEVDFDRDLSNLHLI